MKNRKDIWTTYLTAGYTYNIANDQASAGGVHHHQIRCIGGRWQKRIIQSNGRWHTIGKTRSVPASEGEAAWRCV